MRVLTYGIFGLSRVPARNHLRERRWNNSWIRNQLSCHRLPFTCIFLCFSRYMLWWSPWVRRRRPAHTLASLILGHRTIWKILCPLLIGRRQLNLPWLPVWFNFRRSTHSFSFVPPRAPPGHHISLRTRSPARSPRASWYRRSAPWQLGTRRCWPVHGQPGRRVQPCTFSWLG